MKAKSVGLKVKINFVALKNVNEDEVFQMLEWCENNQFDLTFIEVMPLGNFEGKDRLDQYWSLSDLRNQIERKWTLRDLDFKTGGPAKYSQILETGQKIGFITHGIVDDKMPINKAIPDKRKRDKLDRILIMTNGKYKEV